MWFFGALVLTCGWYHTAECLDIASILGKVNWNIKAEHFMDEVSHCGTINDDVNGYVYSHKDSAIIRTTGFFGAKLLELDDSIIGNFTDTVNCLVTLDVSKLGNDWRIRLSFLTAVDLGGSTDPNCDRLDIYPGLYTPMATPLAGFCGHQGQPPDVLSPGSNVTLRFYGDSDGSSGRGFAIFYTAYRQGSGTCAEEEYACDTSRCIPASFTCDGADHCADKADESEAAGCGGLLDAVGMLLGMGLYTLIGVGAGILVLVAVCIGLCAYCCCRRKKKTPVRRININTATA